MRGTLNDFLNGVIAFNGDANVIQNSVLASRMPLSVMGNASAAGANVADITGTAGQVLVVNNAGTSLAFGQVDVSNSAAVVNRLGAANFRQSAGLSIVGNGTNSTANVADITAGSPNQVLASNSGGTAVAFESLSTLIDGALGSTQGDIIYRGASAWSVLAPGTSGQLLSSGGAAANPSWITASGTGTVTNIVTTYPVAGGPISATGTVTFQGLVSCGRLSRASSTAVQFLAFNGDLIKINGVVYQIPAGGIAGGTNLFAGSSTFVNGTGSSNLSATTFYYVYVFNNSGTLTFDFSTTAHATSATATNVGTEIKNGDDTRTFVGAIYTNSSAITDSVTTRTVISWFNRQRKNLLNSFTAQRTTTSTTLVEVNTEIRCTFIMWADDVLDVSVNGYSFNVGSFGTTTAVGIDATTFQTASTFGGAGASIGFREFRSGITEGALHTATVYGASGSGANAATWAKANASVDTFPSLSGSIMG